MLHININKQVSKWVLYVTGRDKKNDRLLSQMTHAHNVVELAKLH